MLKELCGFMGENPLWEAITLLCLVVIYKVQVEI